MSVLKIAVIQRCSKHINLKYEEAVLLAYRLWEKRKENENPQEKENDVRDE